MPRPLAAVLAAALLSPAAAAASGWRAPVRGAVARPFEYARAEPFARGARRGADFAASAGDEVTAPCSGRVTFHGRVPRFGGALTIRCGALVATLLRVRATATGTVRRGEQVARAEGPVRLGARRASDRFGYLDPLTLIEDDRPRGTPLGPAPAPAGQVGRPAHSSPSPAPPAPAEPQRRPLPARRLGGWPAWAGLGLVLAGLPAGGLVRARRRRGRRREVALGHR